MNENAVAVHHQRTCFDSDGQTKTYINTPSIHKLPGQMSQYPLPFLTADFIKDTMMSDDAAFETAMDQLCKQRVPLNGNADIVYFGCLSPIICVSTDCFWFTKLPHRNARFIEILYLHCGIPTTPVGGLSALCFAERANNFVAFETLVVKCNAALDPRDFKVGSMLHSLALRGDEAKKYLALLNKDSPCMDPNITDSRFDGNTALHLAVSHASQSPEVVRLLLRKFGADPTILNNKGETPLDTLYAMQSDLSTVTDLPAFYAKVRHSERLLTHADRTTAVLMGVCLKQRNMDSELRHLDDELAAMIIGFADE
jgi:hypothetical protein